MYMNESRKRRSDRPSATARVSCHAMPAKLPAAERRTLRIQVPVNRAERKALREAARRAAGKDDAVSVADYLRTIGLAGTNR